jgi:hypothetical protein
MLEAERAWSFNLNNPVPVEVATAWIESVRGYTIDAASDCEPRVAALIVSGCG